jgi:type I restriction enzyme S subunit
MEMENNLPKGWVECSLGEILTAKKGKKPSSVINEPREGYVPYILIDEMEGNPIRNYTNDPKVSIIDETEVLLVWDGSIGKCGSGMKGAIGSTLVGLKALGGIQTKFLEYTIKQQNNFIKETSTGTGLQHINKDFFEICKIPLPPLAEQHRIVAKLDALFEKIESNKQRLEKIPKLLKRFRQSVLAAAVNNDGEEEITNNVCEEIQIGPFGTQLHRHDYISNGIPLVNPTHIQKGEIVPDMDLTITKEKFKELSNYHIKVGDVIMGRRGEMARCALVGEKENGWLCGTGSLFFRPNTKKVHPQYLYWVLSNSNTKTYLENQAKGSTMSNLNLNIVKNIPFPLPLIDEQKRIVKKVEQLFAFADKIEARYTKAKAMLDKLPQSILAKAFCGELVVQDPNDEPASVLLERIKLEKEKLAAEKKAKKTKKYSVVETPVKTAAEKKVKYKKSNNAI